MLKNLKFSLFLLVILSGISYQLTPNVLASTESLISQADQLDLLTENRNTIASLSSIFPQTKQILVKNNSTEVLKKAFENRTSNLQIQGQGTVVKILSDDSQGSKHQRFLLRLSSGQTLLITHNIDLSPRVANLKVGDTVSFYGEYEWNSQGGVIHWTHHDPQKRHINGWLKHQGKTYQ